MIIKIRKLKKKITDKNGFSYVMTAVVMICLLVIFCGLFETYRLNIAGAAVRDKFQSVIMSEAADNYKNMYAAVRDGYAGSQQYDGGLNSWNFDDITTKTRILDNLNTYFNSGEKGQITVTDVDYTVRLPMAATDDSSLWYEIDGVIKVLVPHTFGFNGIPPMSLNVTVHSRWKGEF